MFHQVDVMGWRFVLEHGGSLRGGALGAYGGVPWYGIERLFASYVALLPDKPHCLCIGHIHRTGDISMPRGGRVFVNGAWPATSEWALTEKKAYTVPIQLLLSVHEKQGICQVRHLHLA